MRQRIKVLTLAQQRQQLLYLFPGSRIINGNASQFKWLHKMRPTEESPWYTITLHWHPGRMAWPKVYVSDPKPLVLYPGSKKLPHVWSHEQQQICLHLPHEWNATKSIARYIIPWASEWLYYYEAWVVTGKWLGGGHKEP